MCDNHTVQGTNDSFIDKRDQCSEPVSYRIKVARGEA